jgi:hypothetical protein
MMLFERREKDKKTILMCLALIFAQKEPRLRRRLPDLKFTVRSGSNGRLGWRSVSLPDHRRPSCQLRIRLDNLTKDTVNMDPFRS